jgi:perosamine synthetase
MIYYNSPNIAEWEIKEMNKVLKSQFITTGPKIEEFEEALKKKFNVKHAIVVNSGTAALHCALSCFDIKNKYISVPGLTFIATANAIKNAGGIPVFEDVDKNGIMKKPNCVSVGVDYAGQICNHKNMLVSDAAHSMKFNEYSEITCFSFHAVKHITTGEGGACLTDNVEHAKKIRSFRNHGLGHNYRMTDFQAQLGITQLSRLEDFLGIRKRVSNNYDLYFEKYKLGKETNHLYVIKVNNREHIIKKGKEIGIQFQVHYKPVYDFYKYKDNPRSSKYLDSIKEKILSIPLHIKLTQYDIYRIINFLRKEADFYEG